MKFLLTFCYLQGRITLYRSLSTGIFVSWKQPELLPGKGLWDLEQNAEGENMKDWKAMVRRGAALALLLVMICPAAMAALSYPFTSVTTDSVRMRRSASASAMVLENLKQGASVEVLGETGKYFQVKYNGQKGYILKEFISTEQGVMVTPTPEPVQTAEGYPYTTLTRDSVNLRAKKSVRSTLLRKIPASASITVHSVSGTWAEVTYGRYTGYVKTEFIIVKKIVKAAKATPTPTPVPTLRPEEDAGGYNVLQRGSTGADVKALQLAMIELGFLNGTADGNFGSATENAVIQFQVKNEYPATGVVDANLQAFLYAGKPKNSKGTATKISTLSPAANVSIRKGNTGDAVGELQQALMNLGYYTGNITNTYDTATQKAVKAFQKKNGLTADGVAGQETRAKLTAADAVRADATATPKPTATPTPAPTYAVPTVTVKRGSEGEEAKTVQRRLKELGYYRGNIDGKFGASSVAALKKFQTASGLEADGVAGKGTYAVLFSDKALPNGTTPTPAATAIAAPGEIPAVTYDTLRPGDGGDAVALMQERLIVLGYLSGTADGNYGDKTKNAVRAFQKANGLTVDGSAGTETLTVLYSTAAKEAATAAPTAKATATPAPASATASSGTLRRGDSGDAVKSLQTRLIELGYLTGRADGVYGAKTYQAVISFQQANKLSADGIAGTKTQSKLTSGSAVAANGTAATPAPTAAPTSAPSVTTKPRASQVIYANWYTTVKAIAKKYPYATIYDYGSGISWQIHIFSLGAHADYEPLTASDTAKMERVFGGNTWNPKAVWVIFADGSVYMASTHSKPHDVQHITDNNFDGHSCLHFPRTQEQVESIGQYATSHQATIDAGWAATQKMIN